MKTKSYRFFFFLFRYYHHIFYSARVKKIKQKVRVFFLPHSPRFAWRCGAGSEFDGLFFFISKQKIAPSLSSVSIYVQ